MWCCGDDRPVRLSTPPLLLCEVWQQSPAALEAELSTLFPAAQSITLMRKWWPGGPFSGRCSVRFATAAEAEAVAKRPGVIVQGQVVSACDEGASLRHAVSRIGKLLEQSQVGLNWLIFGNKAIAFISNLDYYLDYLF